MGELANGVRAISTVLNITRTWNAVAATSYMRRGLALARAYARERVAFGAPLARQPLHADTLAGLQAEFEAAFHLAFFVVELLGRDECGEASEEQQALLRLLTPVAKLTTGRQSVAVVSGGPRSLRRRGLRRRHRDCPRSCATRRCSPSGKAPPTCSRSTRCRAIGPRGLAPLKREIGFILNGVRDTGLVAVSARIQARPRAG